MVKVAGTSEVSRSVRLVHPSIHLRAQSTQMQLIFLLPTDLLAERLEYLLWGSFSVTVQEVDSKPSLITVVWSGKASLKELFFSQ